VLALPKGRILKEVMPLLSKAGIEPEAAFDDPDARQLRFATNDPRLEIVRVRSFDVATFVAFGAAHFGVAGSDVIMEFDYPELYAPVDLEIDRRIKFGIVEFHDHVAAGDAEMRRTEGDEGRHVERAHAHDFEPRIVGGKAQLARIGIVERGFRLDARL